MTSATEILLRMLDERGVEWHDTKIGKGFITVYEHDCITWIVTEHSSGRLSVKGCVKPTQGHYDGMTPAQAIAATLGTGTCHEVMINRHWRGCGECGYVWENMYGEGFRIGPNYCPMCGRKVVSE